MKHLYTKTATYLCLLALALTGFSTSQAQGIYRLWSVTANGGTNSAGVIFSAATDGSDLQAEFSLPGGSGGRSPEGKLALYGSSLYGTTNLGGLADAGVIFKYNLATKTYTKVFDFGGTNGANPFGGGLTLYNNKLYGVAQYGGTADKGVLFELDPATDIVTKKIDMAAVGIARPLGCLLEYNNKLYGISHTGGTHTVGTLFEYDPVTNSCTILYSFKPGTSGSDGYYPAIPMLTVYNNRFYGTTLGGGLYNSGTIFQYDRLLNTYTTLHHFKNPDGRNPGSGVTVYNNKLYGLAGGEK